MSLRRIVIHAEIWLFGGCIGLISLGKPILCVPSSGMQKRGVVRGDGGIQREREIRWGFLKHNFIELSVYFTFHLCFISSKYLPFSYFTAIGLLLGSFGHCFFYLKSRSWPQASPDLCMPLVASSFLNLVFKLWFFNRKCTFFFISIRYKMGKHKIYS